MIANSLNPYKNLELLNFEFSYQSYAVISSSYFFKVRFTKIQFFDLFINEIKDIYTYSESAIKSLSFHTSIYPVL